MVLSDARERMLRRAARDILPGMTVNLGIGLPTQVLHHVDRTMAICLHSENGIAGVGPQLSPGVGGAIELAQKARRVGVLTTHTDKKGNPKILERCTLPLTAAACVNRIYSDMAVCDVTPEGLRLTEIAEGTDLQDVIDATGTKLIVPDGALPTF